MMEKGAMINPKEERLANSEDKTEKLNNSKSKNTKIEDFFNLGKKRNRETDNVEDKESKNKGNI
jgi:hypothetical protein